MIDFRSIASVYRFEIRRAATIPRMAWWAALAGFPVLLSFFVSWISDGDPPPERKFDVVRVELTGISDEGLPTLNVDGREMTGSSAVGHIQSLGKSDAARAIGRTLKQFGFDPEAAQRSQQQLAGQRGQDKPEPILIVKLPEGVDPEGDAAGLFHISVERAFSRVVMHEAGDPEPDVQPPSPLLQAWATGLFILLPTVVSMLGVFLWATPAVSAELERRSWVYLATRPNAPVSVMLGKYLVGVSWGISAALTGTAFSLLIADVPEGFMALFKPLALLVILGCPAYGAVYTLIGVIMPRRAMVIAVVYSLVFEGVISTVPALINKVTVQFRLRAMMVRWLGLDRIPESDTVLTTLGLNETSTFVDVTALIVLTLSALTAAVFVLRWQELSQADESDA